MKKGERKFYTCKVCHKPFSALVGSEFYQKVELEDMDNESWPRCRTCMEKDRKLNKEG